MIKKLIGFNRFNDFGFSCKQRNFSISFEILQASSGQSQGATGGQVEEAEDEESSSSSLVENELDTFREKWKKDLVASKGGPIKENSLDSETNSIEEKARQFFLEGVEHEENGELFEAIQKYRKAVALVPDIEFKAFEHTSARKRNKITEEKDEETDDEEVPDLPEDPNEDVQDLLLRFTKLKLKGIYFVYTYICRYDIKDLDMYWKKVTFKLLANFSF